MENYSDVRQARKEIRKKISVTIQLALLAMAAAWMVIQFLELGNPPVFERDRWVQRDGFMAVSYLSLTREEGSGLNYIDQFDEHLAALKEAGYTFITIDDVISFYQGKPLPEKAVFLMFEGGRKDSAIFGQKSLARVSGHAAFFTYTDTMIQGAEFFVTPRQANSISASNFWDVGSQGYKLTTLPNPVVNNKVSYFLCDYLRDASGEKMETDEEMELRLEEFYRLSFDPLERVTSGPLRAFVFPPANSFYDMPYEVELANRRLTEKYFDLSFTREGEPFNAEGQDVFNLTRLQIDPGFGASELLAELQKASQRLEGYSAAAAPPGAWLTYLSEVAVAGGTVTYTPAEADGAAIPAFLQGSHAWENIDLSLEVDRETTTRTLYLRYTSKYSFLRVTLTNNRLQVHERVPGVGLSMIFDRPLPAQSAWRLGFMLRGNRLQITLNGEAWPGGLVPINERLRQGRFGLAANAAAAFGDFSVRSIPALWADLDAGGDGGGGPESGDIVSSAVIRLPQALDGQAAAEDNDRALKELLQSTQKGELAVAALPRGDLNFDEAGLFLSPLNPARAKRLWSGVMVTPEAGQPWEEAARTLDEIRQAGYSPVVRLDFAAAVSLIDSGLTVEADYYVLDFEPADLTGEQWISLANKHNRNHFLCPSLAPAHGDGLYAPRRQW